MHTVRLFIEHSHVRVVLARLPSTLSVVCGRRGQMTIWQGRTWVNLSDDGEGFAEFDPQELLLLRRRFRRPYVLSIDMTGAIDDSRAAEQLARDVLIALVDDDQVLVDNSDAPLRDLTELPNGHQFVRMLREHPEWRFRSPLPRTLWSGDRRSGDDR